MGGVVAFEMAQQLKRAGQEVALLALLDSWAPQAGGGREEQEVELLVWFAGEVGQLFGKEVLITARELREVEEQKREGYILERLKGADILPPELGMQEIKQYLEVFKANMRAMEGYRPRVYEGKVVLLQAERQPPGGHDRTHGWGQLAAGGVEVARVPGDHYTMVRAPQVQVLAERLGAYLEAAQAGTENSKLKTQNL